MDFLIFLFYKREKQDKLKLFYQLNLKKWDDE